MRAYIFGYAQNVIKLYPLKREIVVCFALMGVSLAHRYKLLDVIKNNTFTFLNKIQKLFYCLLLVC